MLPSYQKLICAFILLASCSGKTIQTPKSSSSNFSFNQTIQVSGTPGSLGVTGDTADVQTTTTPGFVLMGGGTDVDAAITWMLQRSGGGDVVVIRASGTNAYNDYMYGLYPVNSVETLLIDSKALANNAQVAARIRQAECLFIAGGDQWQYVNFWKGTKVNNAINYLINKKKVSVGGTSAGCMILGQAVYDAQNGSVTTSQVLNNPYNNLVTFTTGFVNVPVLAQTITDTHYDTRSRQGRHFGFMARLFQDSGYNHAKGIGVSEKTAVCIDENNMGKVYGSGVAYFLNAQTQSGIPELCANGKKLTWNKSNKAVSTYEIKGTTAGAGSVNLNTWQSFTGGTAYWFWSNAGTFTMTLQ